MTISVMRKSYIHQIMQAPSPLECGGSQTHASQYDDNYMEPDLVQSHVCGHSTCYAVSAAPMQASVRRALVNRLFGLKLFPHHECFSSCTVMVSGFPRDCH